MPADTLDTAAQPMQETDIIPQEPAQPQAEAERGGTGEAAAAASHVISNGSAVPGTHTDSPANDSHDAATMPSINGGQEQR